MGGQQGHKSPSEGQIMDLRVGPEFDGLRADVVVARELQVGGRRGAKKLFDRGAVRLEGRPIAKSQRLSAGQVLRVDLSRAEIDRAVPNASIPLEVVLEREDLLIVDKPAGLPTSALPHRPEFSLASALLARYPDLVNVGNDPREAGLVHRLDNDTSGLLICARTPEAYRVLTTAIRKGEIHKEYLLICPSEPLPDRGRFDWPILAGTGKSRVLVCSDAAPRRRCAKARAATTYFEVRRRFGRWALVVATASPATRHQIRAHFAAAGAPLLGDVLYGGAEGLSPGQALHASRLRWDGAQGMEGFDVDREEGMRRLLAKLVQRTRDHR